VRVKQRYFFSEYKFIKILIRTVGLGIIPIIFLNKQLIFWNIKVLLHLI